MTSLVILALAWLVFKGLITYVSLGQAILLYETAVFVLGLVSGGITYALSGNRKNTMSLMYTLWLIYGVAPIVVYLSWKYGIVPVWNALA